MNAYSNHRTIKRQPKIRKRKNWSALGCTNGSVLKEGGLPGLDCSAFIGDGVKLLPGGEQETAVGAGFVIGDELHGTPVQFVHLQVVRGRHWGQGTTLQTQCEEHSRPLAQVQEVPLNAGNSTSALLTQTAIINEGAIDRQNL